MTDSRITVYEVLVDNGSAFFTSKEEAKKNGEIYSVRNFKKAKSYAYFYFQFNNKYSSMSVPDYDISQDLHF